MAVSGIAYAMWVLAFVTYEWEMGAKFQVLDSILFAIGLALVLVGRSLRR
jgi:hypothetical protein